MSLHADVWKPRRAAPDFSQRFSERFSDGNTITRASDYSRDGVLWELDFELTHTKVG